ncbi:phosphatidylinositol transfer protein alpha isoform-like [Babylonia areolata]|uniref:phosphatidylinositol transfer protein alpha isoform-like n=1 Tax=Babylonia areolata TaxID=304850 RepID=UPI003FD3612D
MASALIKPSNAGQIWEYRICLPMSVEEYHVGQLWSVAEASKNETGGGEGLEVLKNEPFDEENNPPVTPLEASGKVYTEGQYTKKIYHLKSKVPTFIRLLAPKGSLEVIEEAWNAYPYCRTVITNPDYMKENFFIIIESFHAPDRGETPNIHHLNDQELKKREVVQIDIAYNNEDYKHDYKPEWDPTLVKSEKTGRGPLPKGQAQSKGQQTPGAWAKTCEPVMCCYKLVRAYFKFFGLQNKVEKFIMKQEKRLFTNFHRQVYCWMDQWHGLTMEDIRRIETETKKELDEKREHGEVCGTKAPDS